MTNPTARPTPPQPDRPGSRCGHCCRPLGAGDLVHDIWQVGEHGAQHAVVCVACFAELRLLLVPAEGSA